MNHLPLSLLSFFLVTVLVGLVLFSLAVRSSKVVTTASLLWISLQATVALSGFYLVTNTLPPRLLLAAAPPLIATAVLFLTPGGRHFIDGMSLKWTVLLHSIRILVEVNLYALFLYKQVPVQMTFESVISTSLPDSVLPFFGGLSKGKLLVAEDCWFGTP